LAGKRVQQAGPRLGAHMSIGGGLHRAVERAEQVEATALQVFVKSSRQWSAKPLARSEVAAFRNGTEARGLAPYTLAHGTYLVNLASPDDGLWRKSLKAFALEVDRCARLGIPYLVVHPGAHVGAGERAGMARVARALRRVLRDRKGTSRAPADGKVSVLLENTAGQGTTLGHRFEQLAWMIERSGVEKGVGPGGDYDHTSFGARPSTSGCAYSLASFLTTVPPSRSI